MSPVGRSLPQIDPVVTVGECCAACSAERAPAGPAADGDSTSPGAMVLRPVSLPVVQSVQRPIRRGDDRRITFAGLLVAAVLLGLAALTTIGSALGGPVWLPVHLALAGAAGTAIAAVLPFFTTALGRVAPGQPLLRAAGIGLVSGGTVLAALDMTGVRPGLGAFGGAAYIAGLCAVAGAAFLPLRATIGFRLRLVPLAYAAALAQVITGVALATAMLAGWAPVAGAWVSLKPAHAWLNVFGFVSVVVAASLIHLAPTVAGARIRPRRSASVALIGLMTGAPLVAIGLGAGWDIVAGVGALVELVGAAGLAFHGAAVQRDRGQWTSDPGWHRFASLSLLAAPAWLMVALAVGASRILWLGATPAAWALGLLAVPLVAGWIGQVMLGSWTHLVPAIGPGAQPAHAVQRRWLGRAAIPRWLAWNGGVALGTIGLLTGDQTLAATGGVALGAALAAGLGLLALAVALSSRPGPAVAGVARP